MQATSTPGTVRRHARALVTVVAVVALAATAAACSRTPTGGTPPPNFGGPTKPLLAGSPHQVITGEVHGLGTVLTTGQGLTLYVYAPDQGRGTSICYDICAAEWPPMLLAPGTTTPQAGPGVETGLLGTTRRTDGTLQVTYAGWPLYRWVGDVEPGQATGQGITNSGGLWWVITPAGKVVR